jgi:hypothetical protein
MASSVIRYLYYMFLIFAGAKSFASGSELKTDKADTKDSIAYRSPYYEDNERCFKCHGQSKYEYTNETLGRQVRAAMFSEIIIDRNRFYSANHRSFSCTDCHSQEYVKFPHSGELRMEQIYNCMDCHGGDDKFAKFNFEAIQSEYQKSTHFKLEAEGFTCWSCHNPHDYKINIRNASDLKEAILYDNNICLRCHSNYNQFQLLSEREEINILQKHEWLPDQETHFKNVRCIECHTERNDTILVSHLINPVEKAVKRCNECHSQNSLLMSSLYKFESKEQRKDGFFNGIIMNESYVIGANRNRYLNNLSIIIFIILSGVITVHMIFRVRKKN